MSSHRRFVPVEEARAAGCREAGALVLLYPLDGTTHVVLTLRGRHLNDHGGQVSLPGGRVEADEDAVACALREAAEELGLSPECAAVLGVLTPLYIPPSGFCVLPVLAVSLRRPIFRPDTSEVEEVIEAPISHFDEVHSRLETRVVDGRAQEVPFYAIKGHKVWGATAMILSELAAVWAEADATWLARVQPGKPWCDARSASA